MSRRHRRAARDTRAARLATLASGPDCNSTVDIEKVSKKIYNATVRHDDTCPWFRTFEASGGLGVRFARKEPHHPQRKENR